MYEVDQRDRVVALSDVPQCCVGAPCPVVVPSESRVSVAYYVQNTPTGWDGTWARMVGADTEGEPAAIVSFEVYRSTMFGMPNDEAFTGHPLAARGLESYSAFEIRNSSWIRKLDRLNSVHPQHVPGAFGEYRHFILSFHDSTFECVALRYRVEFGIGPLSLLVAGVAGKLGGGL